MPDLNLFLNWDLFVLGVIIIATVVLGFLIYYDDPGSETHRSFLGFSLLTALWGIFNYLSYHINPPSTALILLRLTIFAVVWQTYYFLRFAMAFPQKKISSFNSNKWKIILFGTAALSIITLTNLVFKKIDKIALDGSVAGLVNGPAMPLFGIISIGFAFWGIILLLKKTLLSKKGRAKKSYLLISLGVFMMFISIIILNFIFPVFLSNAKFIPYSAIFTFPFIGLTAYAIFKHNLLGVKVITTEVLTFILAIATLIEVIFARELSILVLRSGVFLLVVSFGILLIKSVRKEVQQREKMEELTKGLEKANQELEYLSEQKSQFISFASHDLKSPVALIKQFASLLYDGTYSDKEKIHETAGKIKMTAERAIRLVENFLDLRKIEEGKMEYNPVKTNLVEFIQRISNDFSLIAKQKGILFSFNSKQPTIFVKIDVDKIEQVFQNILDNALKYTESGSISVTITEEQATALVKFTDTGVGMEPEILPTLFEQFHRDPKVAKKIKGTGLGLFIAKQAVLAHQGEIWVESDGEGKGSTFSVRLKKSQ